MAAAFGAATASNLHASLPITGRHLSYLSHLDKVTLRLSTRPHLRFYSKSVQCSWNSSTVAKVQLNEVAVDGSRKATVKPEGSLSEAKNMKMSNEPSEELISDFINQVSSLVKMVDSKDIMELQLKQLDCEILIRKKEVLSLPPVQYVQPQPQSMVTPPVPTVSTVPSAAPSPQPIPAPALPKPQAPKPSHPPFKCPMAGTFYRSPGPGEPPFVKVGDKVKKGQVLCIIEAMKLMNEIEADQSGTLVEILAEDGKPVSVDTHLFVIQP